MEEQPSKIKKFYKNKSILITGATGLVGKLLVFKLLISCNVKRIFILVRSKNGQTFKERLEEFLDQELFNFLPNKEVLNKITGVGGDIGYEDLGLSWKDKQEIIKNVTIVFHSAASIRFTATLKESVQMNVCGTLEVIKLCRQLNRLESLAHISTAFCNPHQYFCEEKVYPAHVKPRDVIHLINLLNNQQLATVTQSYLGPFPNTYTFTKNLAENLINDECQDLPVAILRPSIISSTLDEPTPGWIDTINGLSGGALLAAVGLVRTGRCKLTAKLDLIPLDVFINICIVAGWNTAAKHTSGVRVYNANSYNLGTLSIKEYLLVCNKIAEEYPFSMALRPPAAPMTEFGQIPVVHYAVKIFSETAFAYVLDLMLAISGRKRIVVNYIKRYHKTLETIEFFSTKEFHYKNDNLLSLESLLDEEDEDCFNIKIRSINWANYCKDMYFGGRKFLMKEKEFNFKRDRIRMKILKIAYAAAYLLMFIFVIGLLLIFSSTETLLSSVPLSLPLLR